MPEAPYLHEAYLSLRNQDANWEWILQFDGEAWDPPDYLKDDPRVHVRSNGAKLGVAATRNLALTRAGGEFVQILDADDQLHSGSMEALLEPLLADESLAFCVARTDHLDGDKMRERDAAQDDHGRARIPKPDGGVLKPGELTDYWLHYERMPYATQGTLWRKKFLLAYGGQVALDTGEDSCAALAVAEHHPSFFIKDRWTLVYRAHEHSLMHHPQYFSVSRPRSHIFVVQRLQALRKLRDPSLPFQADPERFAGTEQQIIDRERDVTGKAGMVSILTAVDMTEVQELLKSYAGLCNQDVKWEWLLQVDGEEWEAPEVFRADPRIKIAMNGRHMGKAITANFALARSAGEYIRLLTPGHKLKAGSIEQDLELLRKDGLSYLLFAADLAPGGLPAGAGAKMLDHVKKHEPDPDDIYWRREDLFAVGGFAAAPDEEVSATLVSVAEQYPGHVIGTGEPKEAETEVSQPLASARLSAMRLDSIQGPGKSDR